MKKMKKKTKNTPNKLKIHTLNKQQPKNVTGSE